jgi:glucokinase
MSDVFTQTRQEMIRRTMSDLKDKADPSPLSDRNWLALDVGGTNVIAGLVDDSGRVLARRRFATRAGGRTPQELMMEMSEALRAVSAEAPADRPPRGLAVGLPGWINPAEGLLVQAPNMPGWANVPMAKVMRASLGLPVLLENDTNLYALGEWRNGAGRGLSNLLVITLGTGVGGGLILENRLWTGSFATAVEIGHTPVDLEGTECGCGRRGCLETVASATGMKRLAREWLSKGRPSDYRGRPEELNTEIMGDLARKGDPMSLAVFQEAGRKLGMVLAGVFNLLGLEGVVVGGGAAGAFEFIRPVMWEVLAQHFIIADPAGIKLLKGALGEDAALAGAAVLLGSRLGSRS